jgi:hypothetical protein
MQTSSIVNDGIARIVAMITRSDLDGAKKEIESLFQSVTNEKERGALMAVNGILTSINKKKEGALQSWSDQKVARAAEFLLKSQLADEFDMGYVDALLTYAKSLDQVRKQE